MSADDLPPALRAEPAPERSYQRLAAAIAALIAGGELQPGERLPSERALAERFEVSRTAVREAIIALELQGLVEVRGGSGIYVCAPTDAAAPAAPASRSAVVGQTGQTKSALSGLSFGADGTGPGPFELLRARQVLESEVAALAATSRSDADLDRVFGALADMRTWMNDKARNEAADRAFHLHIAAACGNSVLQQVVQALWDQARGPLWARADQHFHTEALREASQNDHQRIFDALLARDAGAARAAMQAHLDRVIAEFARAWR